MNASAQCPHLEFDLKINLQVMMDSNVRFIEMKGLCKGCNKPLEFHGMPFGSSPFRPTMAVDGSECAVPFTCEGEEPAGTLIEAISHQVL